MENKEVKVVSRNAFSKLRLIQFTFVILFAIGLFGSFANQEPFFFILIIVGFIGAWVIKILRWLFRD
jgi:hypothetical protein